jgi:hypothetical protein
MDLDIEDGDVVTLPEVAEKGPRESAYTTLKAIEVLDNKWLHAAAQRGRWMDLIGDYAGIEPMVLDGNLCPLHIQKTYRCFGRRCHH